MNIDQVGCRYFFLKFLEKSSKMGVVIPRRPRVKAQFSVISGQVAIMGKSKTSLVLYTSLLFLSSLFMLKAQHSFCVNHPKHGHFKANVYFEAMDLGEMAAMAMLKKELQPIWNDSIRIVPYPVYGCACKADCRVLEVRSEKWDSTPATIDSILAGAREAFDNPGQFLKSSLSKAGKIFGDWLK